jgi:hypothetical protein
MNESNEEEEHTTQKISSINTNEDFHEENEADDDDDVIVGNERQNTTQSLQQLESDKHERLSRTSKVKEETNELTIDDNDETTINDTKGLAIPVGWKCGLSRCKRKFFYNDFNKDRWYLNFDPNGKHYFYNSENVSVWNLPDLHQVKMQILKIEKK